MSPVLPLRFVCTLAASRHQCDAWHRAKPRTSPPIWKSFPSSVAIVSAIARSSAKTCRPVFRTMVYGMIGYVIPLSVYPNTYNGQPADGGGARVAERLCVAVPDVDLRRSSTQRGLSTRIGRRQSARHGAVVSACESRRHPLPIVGQAIAKVSAEQFVATYEAARAQTRTATRRANARSTKTRAAAQP